MKKIIILIILILFIIPCVVYGQWLFSDPGGWSAKTWTIGDIIVEGGLFYYCNTTGAQDTDFATNAGKWDEYGALIANRASKIIDSDKDTGIDVEVTPDSDIIVGKTLGVERFKVFADGTFRLLENSSAASGDVSVYVAQSSDDAHEDGGAMDLTATSINMPNRPDAGFRFQVAIPNGATITNAYIEFLQKNTYIGNTNFTITAEAIDDSPTFTTAANDITTRTKTGNSVAWTLGDVVGDTRYQSDDISAIINEVVNRSGWNSGNSLSILLHAESGVRKDFRTYDQSPGDAARLYVEYTTSAGGSYIEYIHDGLNAKLTTNLGKFDLTTTDASVLPVVGFNNGTEGMDVFVYGGSPEGVISSNTGSLAINTTTGELYTKTTNSGSTGWVTTSTASALGTHIFEGPADTDLMEFDPGDPTKARTKAEFKFRTVEIVNGISRIKSVITIPALVEITNTIPAASGEWVAVKDDGAGNYEFVTQPNREDFNLSTECPIGRIQKDAVGDVNFVVSTPELGFGYAQTLYDLISVTGVSKHISGGDLQAIDGTKTLKRLEGKWWRTFANRDETNPHKMTNTDYNPITDYEMHSETGDVEILSEMEVGYIDDGAGGKTVIAANEWSFYLCYHWPRTSGTGFEGFQRSIRSYTSLHQARSLKSDGISNAHTALDAAVLTHIIYIRGDATDFGDSEQCVIEWVRKDNISSSGDPIVGELQQSGIIDWVGTDILTINADPTKFDRSEICIGFVDRETGVKFIRTVAGATDQTVTNLTSDPFTYYGYNITTDSFIQQSTPMARTTLDNIISIGRLWHRDKTVIDLAQTMPLVVETSHDYAGQLLSFGALKQSGLNLSANGSNKKVNLATGILEVLGGTHTVRENISNAQPTTSTPLSFTPVHRAVTTGNVVFETVTDDPDYTVFDDGSGTLAALSPNNFGIHYFYIFPYGTTDDVFLVRGDQSYATLEEAQTGLQRNPIPIPTDFNNGFFFSAVIAKETTTDLQAAITAGDAVIVSADRFGSFGAGGGGGGSVVAISIYFGAKGATGTTSGTTPLKVPFSAAQVIDPQGGFDDANDWYVIPEDGDYLISGGAGFIENGLNSYWQMWIYKNGSTMIAQAVVSPANNDDASVVIGPRIVSLVAGDTIHLHVRKVGTSSGFRFGDCFFTVTKL